MQSVLKRESEREIELERERKERLRDGEREIQSV